MSNETTQILEEEQQEVNMKTKPNRRSNERQQKRNRAQRRSKSTDNFSNDPSWYYDSEDDFQSIMNNTNFVRATGNPIQSYNGSGSANLSDKAPDSQSIPGIMTIALSPTYGYSDNSQSDFNIAVRELQKVVRTYNTGFAKNYQLSDLMSYIIALDNVYMWWENVRRVLSYMNTFSKVNRYVAEGLVRALGFDYDDLIIHSEQIRTFMNNSRSKINGFTIPQYLKILRRHQYIYSYVFCDTQNSRGQIYAYVPRTFLKYGKYTRTDASGNQVTRGELHEITSIPQSRFDQQRNAHIDSVNGSGTRYVMYDPDPDQPGTTARGLAQIYQVSSHGDDSSDTSSNSSWTMYAEYVRLTYADVVAITNELLQAFLDITDLDIIAGDVAKIFGNATYELPFIPFEDPRPIFPDTEIQMQMHNATLVGPLDALKISQNTTGNVILSTPRSCKIDTALNSANPYRSRAQNWTGLDKSYGYNWPLNFINPQQTPDAKAVLTSTRLCNLAKKVDDGTDSYYYFDVCGSEIAEWAIIHTFDYSNVLHENKNTVYNQTAVITSYPFMSVPAMSMFPGTMTTAQKIDKINETFTEPLRRVLNLRIFYGAPHQLFSIVLSDKGLTNIGSETAYTMWTTEFDVVDFLNYEQLDNINKMVVKSLFSMEQTAKRSLK